MLASQIIVHALNAAYFAIPTIVVKTSGCGRLNAALLIRCVAVPVMVAIHGYIVHTHTVEAVPSAVTIGTNRIGVGMEGARIAAATNPIMPATIFQLAARNTSAFPTTETDTIGAHGIEGEYDVIRVTIPGMLAHFVLCLGRMTRVTRPSMTQCTESIRLEIVNGRASATPGFIRRAYFVRSIHVVTRRAFPAVYARRIGRIDAVTTFFTAPTVMMGTILRFQMTDFTTGICFIDMTIPRVIVRKGWSFSGGIISNVTGFAEPISLRTRRGEQMSFVTNRTIPRMGTIGFILNRMYFILIIFALRAIPIRCTTVVGIRNVMPAFMLVAIPGVGAEGLCIGSVTRTAVAIGAVPIAGGTGFVVGMSRCIIGAPPVVFAGFVFGITLTGVIVALIAPPIMRATVGFGINSRRRIRCETVDAEPITVRTRRIIRRMVRFFANGTRPEMRTAFRHAQNLFATLVRTVHVTVWTGVG